MSNNTTLIFVMLVVIGCLTGSTVYFYTKSQTTHSNSSNTTTSDQSFRADLPTATANAASQKIDELTKPATPKGRLSYPANVYSVDAKETLFAIGQKFGLPWTTIKEANGIVDQNIIQAGYPLIIPKVSNETGYYRVEFVVNDPLAIETNKGLQGKDQDDLFDPLKVAKKNALAYFATNESDQFRLVEANLAQGVATVEAKAESRNNLIGLIQPKTKGEKGFWVVYYVEQR